jgi:hypothetical protein
MNTGTGKGISVVLRKKLLRFNGGLFADDTVCPSTACSSACSRKPPARIGATSNPPSSARSWNAP